MQRASLLPGHRRMPADAQGPQQQGRWSTTEPQLSVETVKFRVMTSPCVSQDEGRSGLLTGPI